MEFSIRAANVEDCKDIARMIMVSGHVCACSQCGCIWLGRQLAAMTLGLTSVDHFLGTTLLLHYYDIIGWAASLLERLMCMYLSKCHFRSFGSVHLGCSTNRPALNGMFNVSGIAINNVSWCFLFHRNWLNMRKWQTMWKSRREVQYEELCLKKIC